MLMSFSIILNMYFSPVFSDEFLVVIFCPLEDPLLACNSILRGGGLQCGMDHVIKHLCSSPVGLLLVLITTATSVNSICDNRNFQYCA